MMMELKYPVYIYLFLTELFWSVNSGRATESSKNPHTLSDNCSVHAIRDVDNTFMTRKEELAQLDAALNDSIKKRDKCEQKALQQQKSASSSANSGAGTSQLTESSNVTTGTASTTPKSEQQRVAKSTKEKVISGVQHSNGALPEDIPPADNDTVLQKQIRAAAMKETDAEKKKKLWDMYRKYKH